MKRNHLVIALLIFCLGAPAAADPLYATDLVFPPKGFGRPHGASLVELSNGDLLATWFSSEIETGDDARIFGSRWNRTEGTWGAPQTIVPDDYSKSVGNTALYRDDDGRIWLFFAAVVVGGWSGAMVDYVQSTDEGASWTKGERLVGWLGNLPRNLPIKTGDHQMLVPLFIDFWYEANLVGSYTATIKYRDGVIVEKSYASLKDHDAIQPTLVKLPKGDILLLARDKSDRFIRRAWSRDNGRSWVDEGITTLPNPGSAIAATYIDELGCVLLAYNHSRTARNPLSLAVSFDGGKSFRKIIDLEYKEGEDDVAFAYPTLLRTADGLIHAIWSHDKRATLKHARFNVAWLRQIIEKQKRSGE